MSTVRAAMHVHSDWSYDGHLSLIELAELFRRQRYDVVFMCEHDRGFSEERFDEYRVACETASTRGALLVPGIEYADGEDRVHVPVWGPLPFLGEGVPTTELLERVSADGGVSVLAHPVRRDAWKVVQPRWLELSTGIEVWTRKWDGWAPNTRALGWASAHGLVPIVSLDLHRSHQTFPLAMKLELDQPLEATAAVEAIRQGRCRAAIGMMPVDAVSGGGAGRGLQAIEKLRRPLWRRARRARDRLAQR